MIVLNEFRHDARVHKEAKTLARVGHDILVLALGADNLPNSEVVDGFNVRRVPVRTKALPNCPVVRIIQYLEYSVRTLLVALSWQADVYHAHNVNTLPVGRAASWLQGASLIYDAHELETGRNWGSSTLSSLIRNLWSLPERLFIRGTDTVITVCDSIAAELERLYDIEALTVVRNVPEYQPGAEPVNLHQITGVGDEIPLLLYQGGVKANRGIEQALEAIELVNRGALIVLGDGPGLPRLREDALEMGLAERVFFLGHIPLETLPRYTASCDVGLALIQNACLSYYYSLPNKLFEYLQAGLPVVVSDFPEMARIVRECDVGELVDPSKPAEIAAAIERIVTDGEYYRRLQRNAKRASAVLTWEQEAPKLVELYRTLA